MKRTWVRVLAIVGVVLLLAVGAFLLWALTPLGPEQVALDALESDGVVTVTETDAGYEFTPLSTRPTSAFVFYPGGRVDVRSYAPLARQIAMKGHLVVLVPMPLSLAVLSPDAGQRAIDAHEEINTWAIGGHSLGGAMAAQFASTHAEELDALVLYAAYASGDMDLTKSGLVAVDIRGTEDGVLDLAAWEAGKALMPARYTETIIDGGNHAQFGDYGPQPGDNPATITAPGQQKAATDATDEAIQAATR